MPGPDDRKTILVVDDHDLLRLGLRTLLQSQASAGSEGDVLEARSLQEAMAVYRQQADRIGAVLLDLELPDAHGLTGVRTFLAEFPAARIAVLSGSTDPGVQQRALSAGAVRYLAKSADLAHVLAYLRNEGWPGGPAVAVDDDRSTAAPAPQSPGLQVWTITGQAVSLTERQFEILEWVRAGRSNRQIAEATRLSEGTVKNYVSSLLLAFGVRSRTALIACLR